MSKPDTVPTLTTEQQQALDASDGIVQGDSYVLMRTDVVLNWFGYSENELRQHLQPALKDVERGDVAEWDLQSFLAEMHSRHDGRPRSS